MDWTCAAVSLTGPDLNDLAATIWARLNELAIEPLAQLFRGLDQSERTVLCVLLATAAAVGFIIGRRRSRRIGRLRFPNFQNKGEALVSRVLRSDFGPPDYHLMNHVTIQMDDGTTEIDHILVSRFGVFVIETKHYTGWLFANETGRSWTQVRFRARFRFQNPILQNRRHVHAVQGLLDFLPPDAVKSVVVFSGNAEFKTEVPDGVITVEQLAAFVRRQSEEVMSLNRLQFCVGRLETARLAISAETDVQHVESLARRHGQSASFRNL
jgi:hypothetical protein